LSVKQDIVWRAH